MIENFNDNSILLPIVINFSIQKNITTLKNNIGEIEKLRFSIGEKYGDYNDSEESYKIRKENIGLAQKELNQLLEIQQSLDIRKIKLTDLEGIHLTPKQMQALLFMIEEE